MSYKDSKQTFQGPDDGMERALQEHVKRELGSAPEFPPAYRKALADRIALVDARNDAEQLRNPSTKRRSWRIWGASAMLAAAAAFVLWIGGFGTHRTIGFRLMEEGAQVSDGGELTRGAVLATDGTPSYSLLDGRAHIVLDAHTEVIVAQANELVLEKGEIWVHVRSGSGPFSVRVPDVGTVDVIGTSFLVRAGVTQVPVETFEGTVTFTPSGIKSATRVPAGYMISKGSGGFSTLASRNSDLPTWARGIVEEYQRKSLLNFFPSTAEVPGAQDSR